MAHPFDGVDLRLHPERYRVGRGEYGVFHAEPYKSELLPLWTIRDVAVARQSADALYARYRDYRAAEDFVMDLARKFLQMGYTRARRYANHKGAASAPPTARLSPSAPATWRRRVAEIFRARWREIAADADYRRLKERHQRMEHGEE